MKVLLFSRDEKLADCCREILTEIAGTESKLVVGLPGQMPSQDDLCLWDFLPGETPFPEGLGPAELQRHLFVLHRKQLPALQKIVGTSDIKVLLKPVTPATLRVFLNDACPHGEHEKEPPPGNIDTLRVERDEMLQFLIQANLRLQEHDRERTNLLARSIHDFRAPLTAITGYCGLLLEEELGPLTPDQCEVLGRMQQSATRLSRITSSMCRLGVSQNVDQKLICVKGDMRDCVDQALHEVALRLEDKRISVRVEIQQPVDDFFFDKSQIEQALVTLLDNACKFTPRDGTIEIRGYPFFWERRTCRVSSLDPSMDRRIKQVRTANSFRVDIRDPGPGIPAMHVARIFEENSSYSGGQDRSGGGLGLAICRMILQRHGGQVWAESHTAGAVFSFVLPVQPVDVRTPTELKGPGKACLAWVEEES